MTKKWLVDDARQQYIEDANDFSRQTLDKSLLGNTIQLEMYVEIGNGISQIRLADRNKYINNNFYDGRMQMPKMDLIMSNLTDTSIKFSEMNISITNVDGKYTKYLTDQSDYRPFINETVNLFMSINDNTRLIFSGVVKSDGGITYNKDKIEFSARDPFESLNTNLPLPTINKTDFPNAPNESVGKPVPFYLGDFLTNFNIEEAGAQTTSVWDGTEKIQVACKCWKAGAGFNAGVIGYNVGGYRFVYSIGSVEATNIKFTNIQNVLIKRGEHWFETYHSLSPIYTSGFYGIDVLGFVDDADGGLLPYIYENGDIMIMPSKAFLTDTYTTQTENIIYQAYIFLIAMGRLTSGNFNTANYNEAYTQLSAISSRFWAGDANINIMGYFLGLLKQVHYDAIFANNGTVTQCLFKPLRTDSMPQISNIAHISMKEVVDNSINIQQDIKNLFTRASGTYSFSPISGGNSLKTSTYYNNNAETKLTRVISRIIDFPNLYVEAQVITELQMYVRLFSACLETITLQVSWIALSLNLGDFITISCNYAGLQLDNVPCQIRAFAVDSSLTFVTLELLSFINFAFPTYTPKNPTKHLSSCNQELLLF